MAEDVRLVGDILVPARAGVFVGVTQDRSVGVFAFDAAVITTGHCACGVFVVFTDGLDLVDLFSVLDLSG